MKDNKQVSQSVVRRLPRYFRHLNDLYNRGVRRISSKALSEEMKITASQIRQDLNCFGGFGQQGYGYNIETLLNGIRTILGADGAKKVIIVGMGNMGTALAQNMNFAKRGVVPTGLFDCDPSKIGKTVNGLTIRSTDELELFCKNEMPDIAVLTVPKDKTKETASRLFEYGIKGFWNFASVDIDIEGAQTETVHLGDSLMLLCYKLKNE